MKVKVPSECAAPGASMAQVALARGLNANLVHSWRRQAGGAGLNILCDAKLKAMMGKDEVTMFEMTGLVGRHLSQV